MANIPNVAVNGLGDLGAGTPQQWYEYELQLDPPGWTVGQIPGLRWHSFIDGPMKQPELFAATVDAYNAGTQILSLTLTSGRIDGTTLRLTVRTADGRVCTARYSAGTLPAVKDDSIDLYMEGTGPSVTPIAADAVTVWARYLHPANVQIRKVAGGVFQGDDSFPNPDDWIFDRIDYVLTVVGTNVDTSDMAPSAGPVWAALAIEALVTGATSPNLSAADRCMLNPNFGGFGEDAVNHYDSAAASGSYEEAKRQRGPIAFGFQGILGVYGSTSVAPQYAPRDNGQRSTGSAQGITSPFTGTHYLSPQPAVQRVAWLTYRGVGYVQP